MSFTIKLTKNHKRILLEAIIESMKIKEDKLKNPASLEKMNAYYIDAAHKIGGSEIECGSTKNNIFVWLRDQFYHSRGFPNTEFGKLAISICEAAGSNDYDSFTRMTIINTLFE